MNFYPLRLRADHLRGLPRAPTGVFDFLQPRFDFLPRDAYLRSFRFHFLQQLRVLLLLAALLAPLFDQRMYEKVAWLPVYRLTDI